MSTVGEGATSQAVSDVDLTARIGDELVLPNPMMTASGCAAAGMELAPFLPLDRIGAVVTKSIMANPRSGRATPRMAETPSGMLNSIGLQGPGIDQFLASDLPALRATGARAVVSIAGSSVEEFQQVAERVGETYAAGEGPVALEVNVSCPNVANRSLVFSCDPAAVSQVVAAVKAVTPSGLPVWVKLSPDVTDIVSIAFSAVDAGADGLTLINTLLGMVIDPASLRPALAGVTGGLSGPAIRAVAIRCLYQVHAVMPEVPLIGVGGVASGADALAMLAAGASAVQVGTTTFHDPGAIWRIAGEVADELEARGLTSVEAAVGLAHRAPEQVLPDERAALAGDPAMHARPDAQLEEDYP